MATLVVEDDGPGFAEEVSREMFRQRVKGKDSSGHGLGLAFVEAVVRAHGGTVSATNRAEGGARLTITLPCVSESQAHGASSLGALVG
jgi:signal transduction histidine kinase